MIEPVPAGPGHFGYRSQVRVSGFLRLARIQWRLERFMLEHLEGELPTGSDERITVSLALGLAALAHTLRLPGHRPEELARWLADPASAPAAARATLARLQKIQLRRTQLAAAWKEAFPPDASVGTGPREAAPGFIWEGLPAGAEPAPPPAPAQEEKLAPGETRATPVFAGVASGRVELVDLQSSASSHEPGRVLVFAQARPEAVEHFAGAAALIFCEGGVLSHACTVAREQRIPCVTAAGPDFLRTVRSVRGEARAQVDGARGRILILSVSAPAS
jgi:phosphohistidine swiveling domain-containing protein